MIHINLEKLKNLRKDAKFSISFVSNELGYKTPTGYWLVEHGERKVSVDILFRLAKLYNVPMDELLIVE
ncbi:helix-turn-helix domain-containing protein [Lysinibacillus pakistanensis]|uniref:helix-turn-helix domain-containing protein n=1 Tax=Lysinibacillus pakistanensis TaxID=759811 RepID=UPI003D2E6F5D